MYKFGLVFQSAAFVFFVVGFWVSVSGGDNGFALFDLFMMFWSAWWAVWNLERIIDGS